MANLEDESLVDAQPPIEGAPITTDTAAAAVGRHDVEILYGDDGHPILLIVNGRQYVVGHGNSRARHIPPQQPARPPPPPLPSPQTKGEGGRGNSRVLVGLNVILVLAVAGLMFNGGPPSITIFDEVLDWVCSGNHNHHHHHEACASLEDPATASSSSSTRVCMCGQDPDWGSLAGLDATEGGQLVTTFAEWPLHTHETFDSASWKQNTDGIGFVDDKEIELRAFDVVIRALAAHATASSRDATGPLLCMHHLAHARPYAENARVCVLFRGRNRVFPLYNLDLKGYSNESTTLPETSVVCGATPLLLTRTRRLVVDIAYTTVSGVHMRSLIDDPKESFAIQRVWEEFRGTYEC